MSLLNGNNKGKAKKGAKTAATTNVNKFGAGKGNSKGAGNKSAVRTGGTRGS
ncbi:MAG: hypothetical protein JNL72_13715 [Flavipsychrobacter sp.]|nr:hypothetical protein [Flavipsychrobacter sp.]